MNKSRLTFDKKALVQIYERHSPEIFRYAYRILDSQELAEDCVADTFLRLLIAVRGGIVAENVRAYLFRIAHNWIMDHYRRHLPVQMSLEEDLHANSEGNPSQSVEKALDRQRIRSALLKLTPEQRTVIELRFIENCSHLEVAAVLGRTVEATRALQKRALETLRQILAVGGNRLVFQNAEASRSPVTLSTATCSARRTVRLLEGETTQSRAVRRINAPDCKCRSGKYLSYPPQVARRTYRVSKFCEGKGL